MIKTVSMMFRPASYFQLKPVGMPRVRCLPVSDFSDWYMTQKFIRMGEEISLIAFGRDRREMLANFEQEKENVQ